MLRLVHSGFAQGTDWEDELFGGTERGWRYELRSLRHYLERHAGTDRRALWPRAKVRGTAAEVWNRLLGKDGFTREGRIEGLNDSLACLRTHDVGGPSPDSGHVACLWLSTWGTPKSDVDALGARWRALLDRLATSESRDARQVHWLEPL